MTNEPPKPKKPIGRARGSLPTGKKRGKRQRITGDGDTLSERENLFISHYLADPERQARRAAINAGYNPAAASSQGSRLLAKPAVREVIRARMIGLTRELEITAHRTLQRLAQIGYSNMLDFIEIDRESGHASVNMAKVDRTSAGAIKKITTETYTEGRGDDARLVTRTALELHDPRPALVTLAQHLKIIGDDATGGDVRTVRFIIEGAPAALVEQYERQLLNVTPSQP